MTDGEAEKEEEEEEDTVMESDPDFYVNARTREQAASLTAALRERHETQVLEQRDEIIRSLRTQRRPERSFYFTEPLDGIDKEIPLQDLLIDVEEFGILSAFARVIDNRITTLQIGEHLPVPVLPARGLLRTVLRYIEKDGYRRFFDDFSDTVSELTRGETVVKRLFWEEAKECFFSGLFDSLTTRIAGVRWLWHLMATGGGGASGLSGGSITGQWWTAHTRASGLSLYYGLTHAVRNPPNYLNGITTGVHAAPLPVFLPVGTLYMAADAGPGGTYVWDNSVVTVPSHTPSFSTSSF